MLRLREAVFIVGTANVLSAVFVIVDKIQALRQGRRVSEKNLCVLALCGGWPAGVLFMSLFRHKTKKHSFQFAYGLSVLLNVYVTFSLLSPTPAYTGSAE